MTVTRELLLPYRPPLDAAALRGHFAARAIPGIEALRGPLHIRTLHLPHGPAVARTALPDRPDGHLRVVLALADGHDEAAALARLRALYDLDGDPAEVAAVLGDDPLLGAAVRAAPGRRVPGAADATELAIRAVLGQQVSLAGAATAAGRLVARCGPPLPAALIAADPSMGEVTHLFPTAATLAALDPESLGMPHARGRALVALAGAVAAGTVCLERGADVEAARDGLLALPGIGPWTADYILMRALGDHDIFLPTDLGVRRALQRASRSSTPRAAAALAAAWSPLRAYAMEYLWGTLTA